MINSDLLEINVFFSPTAHNQIGHPFQVSTQIDPGRSSFDFTPGFVRGGPSRVSTG